nr:hypothetical protein [Roseburia sp. AM59-24XD]
MANKRLDYDMIYELVMQCCKSSLSDRQWCLDNDIVPSTFYYWVRKLRQRACYDLPETECSGRNVSSAEKQDVVCVNIQPDPVRETAGIPAVSIPGAANIFLQYGGVSIALSNDFEEQTWDNERGYLMDTCLTAQDRYKRYLEYFRIKY